MVRVSSFGQQQLLIRAVMDNQQSMYDAQRQVSTGKKTDEYRGMASDANTILGTRSFKSRVESYQQSISTIRGKLDANDLQVNGIIDAMEKLKETIKTTLANNQAAGFDEFLDQTYKFAANSLNTNYDGTYLFSGAETGTKPVNATTLADLDAIVTGGGTVSDAFDNAPVAFEARIADGVNLNFGLLASDVGSDIFQVMYDIHDEIQTNGAIDGELTQAQYDFLQTQVSALDNAIDSVRQAQVQNGLAYNRLDVVNDQHTDTQVFLETFIADMEDVDIAEAVTRLLNDQVALQASYQSISSLSQLTLLKFL